MGSEQFKIAAVRASSVFPDRDATVDKARRLIEEASKAGATLVAFPEAFVSGYPVWVWFIPSGQTHALRSLFTQLVQSAVSIPDPAVSRLAAAAGVCKVTVAIGVNEKNSEASNTTLYNTLLYLGPDGAILGKHRKLIPTAGERLVWGQGAEADLEVFRLPFGRLGGLISGRTTCRWPATRCPQLGSKSTSHRPGIVVNRGSQRCVTSARRQLLCAGSLPGFP